LMEILLTLKVWRPFGDRGVWEERTGEESVLGDLFRDRRYCACTGCGPGDSSADYWNYYGGGGLEGSGPLILHMPDISCIPGPGIWFRALIFMVFITCNSSRGIRCRFMMYAPPGTPRFQNERRAPGICR
jgi:hypothetical protein